VRSHATAQASVQNVLEKSYTSSITIKSSTFSIGFRGISRLGSFFQLFAMIQTCVYLYSSNFTPQVKEARNQSQIFNRKSISRNTTHRQSYHLQAMLTGVKRKKANTSSEKLTTSRL